MAVITSVCGQLGGRPVPESTWWFLKAFQIFRLAAIGHGGQPGGEAASFC